MILKDGTKHACRSCITGHRSSKCVHHDRELFPIAKKGRPSTQCKACKQRGTPGGRCECQLKRKPKSKADELAGDGFGQSSGYAPEGFNSRKDSGGSQISNYPTPEDGSYSRMMSFPSALDGTSTRATNSSASSPSYTQQSFAIHHAPLDSQAVVAAGLPFPQPDTHFAYGIHHDTHGHSQAGLPELPPPRSNPPAGRSRPTTAGEEDVPWWLYRAGYSPNSGIPYEPPGDGPASANGPAGIYPDYGHYLAQPSPYNLGTPGAPPQASPAFVWHNNATSYRDYMANQQVGNYQSSSSQTAPVYHHHHPRAAEQHNQHPSLSHHHSLPYLSAHTSTVGESTAPHSAPAPLSSIPQQHFSQRQRPPHDPSWASMSMESSNSGHYVVSSTGHDRRPSDQPQHGHPTTNKTRVEEVPALAYDSGASPLASTESLLSMNNSTMPFHLGYMPPTQYKTDHRYDSRPNSQSNMQSPEAALHERRSTSFDQLASRASPINLKLPEDRKKRKLELDI